MTKFSGRALWWTCFQRDEDEHLLKRQLAFADTDSTEDLLPATACTPETPIGTCMVSSEGACAAYYNYGRFSMAAQRRTIEMADIPVIE